MTGCATNIGKQERNSEAYVTIMTLTTTMSFTTSRLRTMMDLRHTAISAMG